MQLLMVSFSIFSVSEVSVDVLHFVAVLHAIINETVMQLPHLDYSRICHPLLQNDGLMRFTIYFYSNSKINTYFLYFDDVFQTFYVNKLFR
jgi:hypothetical protein